jgi:hypothetical protein
LGFSGVVVRIITVPVGAVIEKLPSKSVVVVFDAPPTETIAPATTGPGPGSSEAALTVPLTVAIVPAPPDPPLPPLAADPPPPLLSESPQPTRLKVKPILKNNQA